MLEFSSLNNSKLYCNSSYS